MKKIVLVVIAVVVIPLFIVGCTEPSVPPPTTYYPRIVLDFSEEGNGNITTICVLGVEIIRYSNISMYIDEEEIMSKKNAFTLEYETEKEEFHLEIYADTEDNNFFFHVDVKVINVENLIFELTDMEGSVDNIRKADLPHTQRFNRVEEE
ncbi:MAG: hypothetical protein R6U17_03990 [Thermoplasmata archaeon]